MPRRAVPSEQRQLAGGGSIPPVAGIPASSSSPRKIDGAARREVVLVVVEERVDLVGLLGRGRRRLDPLGQLLGGVHPVEAVGGRAAADVPRLPVAAVEADVRDAVGRGRDARRRRSSRASAARRRRRRRARAARGTRACRRALRARSTSGAGTRRAARAGRAPSRARASSAFASGDLTKRGWYWSRTPRSLPDSSSGSIEPRNSANACVGRLALVAGHRGAGLDVEDEARSGVRSAQRRVTSGSGRRRTASRPRRRRTARRSSASRAAASRRRAGTSALSRPSSAQLHVPRRTVAAMAGR